jgi:hypothetical protein
MLAAPAARIIQPVAIALNFSAALAVSSGVAVQPQAGVFEAPVAVLGPISVSGWRCKGRGSGNHQARA